MTPYNEDLSVPVSEAVSENELLDRLRELDYIQPAVDDFTG